MTAMGLGSAIPQGGWTVTGQVPSTRLVAGNARPVEGYVVSFTTGYNVNGSVFVPAATYTAESVRAAIAATVAQLDAVSQLTHDTGA